MWHYGQSNPKDILIARQILFSLEHSGFKVFPDFNTAWHFDDKAGQKYLFEALDLPMVRSYVFVDRTTALTWAENTAFPKVFKLRGGAGSANVKLASNKKVARSFINQAFNSGFSQYDALSNLKDRFQKYREGRSGLLNVLKGIIRIGYEPEFSKIIGKERGYVYFQDFIPGNSSDTRIIVIDDKAFGLKRGVRKGDFRASGSGEIMTAKEEIDERCVKMAFLANEKIKSQCIAYDFVFDQNDKPLIIEISYGFTVPAYDACPGYWTSNMEWHKENFNPQGWMVQALLKSINEKE